MLSQAELQARIAAEFLRVGASQQSWDQNFPSQPSTWVQDAPHLDPRLSSDSATTYEALAGDFFVRPMGGALLPEGADPIGGPAGVPQSGDHLNCPPPSRAQYISGRWLCLLPDGSLVTSPDPDEDFVWTPSPTGQGTGTGSSTSPVQSPTSQASGALPPFIGGRLGKVLYTPISNRNLNGVRIGILPRVVMGDVAPAGYGTVPGVAAGGGGNDLVQP